MGQLLCAKCSVDIGSEWVIVRSAMSTTTTKRRRKRCVMLDIQPQIKRNWERGTEQSSILHQVYSVKKHTCIYSGTALKELPVISDSNQRGSNSLSAWGWKEYDPQENGNETVPSKYHWFDIDCIGCQCCLTPFSCILCCVLHSLPHFSLMSPRHLWSYGQHTRTSRICVQVTGEYT